MRVLIAALVLVVAVVGCSDDGVQGGDGSMTKDVGITDGNKANPDGTNPTPDSGQNLDGPLPDGQPKPDAGPPPDGAPPVPDAAPPDGTPPSPDAAPPPLGTKFALTAANWPVPKHKTRLAGFDAIQDTNFGNHWVTFDITGDGRPDLVWYADANGKLWKNIVTKKQYWKVFKNTGAGFATSANNWYIPTNPTDPDGFDRVFGGTTTTQWNTMDMNGDGKPDLVHCQVFGSTSPHWNVYLSSGSSFASQATSWPIPKHPTRAQGFNAIYGGGPKMEWTTLDMTGDGRPDLVWYANDGSNVWLNPIAKKIYWKVYKNTGTGFATSYTSWTVPPHPTRLAGFDLVYGGAFGQEWTTLDMTGDGRPDLVWYADDTGKAFYSPLSKKYYWRMYENTGGGFDAQPKSFWIPKHPTRTAGFDSVFGGTSQPWTTLDLNGDKKPDLVWYADDSSKVWNPSVPYWKVFLGSGSSFGGQANWPVPKHTFSADGFDLVHGYPNGKDWYTMEIDGDGRPDLVWYASDKQTVWNAATSPYWKVFFNKP